MRVFKVSWTFSALEVPMPSASGSLQNPCECMCMRACVCVCVCARHASECIDICVHMQNVLSRVLHVTDSAPNLHKAVVIVLPVNAKDEASDRCFRNPFSMHDQELTRMRAIEES